MFYFRRSTEIGHGYTLIQSQILKSV